MFSERSGRPSGERSPVSERGGERSRFGGGVEFPGMEDVLMSNRSSTTSAVAAPAVTPATSSSPNVTKPDLVMFEETEVIEDVEEEVADEVEFHIPPAPSTTEPAAPGAGEGVATAAAASRSASPVSIRRDTFESDRMMQEEQYRMQEKAGVYPGIVEEEETHFQSPLSSVPTQQYPPDHQEKEQYSQEYRQHDTDMETEEHHVHVHAPSSTAATTREIAVPSTPLGEEEMTQPQTTAYPPETTSSTPGGVASTSTMSAISLSITNKALDSEKKKRDSKEHHDALKAQEDAKIEELKKTIADLQRQEQDIIRLIRGMGTPSEMISQHIHELHEYNEIKDVGQVILGKCAELEGTTIKTQYENFGLEMDD
ncbi:swi5-like zinc finger protein [Mortierella hygrophila]|uniref:Swi5-like zinc finger protein n=1 Tax=Mortierella hygrophila TaxID=979708 RepID=A0A9P6JZY0_9FUNG|nr:swi5-like zinc finger protein [Mortierella hygrophila]